MKKNRETFTVETMRKAKALTKACPGYYKKSEKPKDDVKVQGHYKPATKHRIIWDEYYEKGKAAGKVSNHHTKYS